MKTYIIASTLVLATMGILSSALANPSMLPKHPGYPSRGEFANDTGQQNLTASQSLLDAAAAGNVNMVQELDDPNNPQIQQPQGTEQSPVVQRSDNKIAPPGKEGTQMPNK